MLIIKNKLLRMHLWRLNKNVFEISSWLYCYRLCRFHPDFLEETKNSDLIYSKDWNAELHKYLYIHSKPQTIFSSVL